jgi:hypothetical protein
MILTNDPITFNGTNLNSLQGWLTTKTDTYRYQDRKLANFDIINSDNVITTNANYTGKKINVSGVIRVDGRETLDTVISELKRILHPINKTLSMPVAGVQRIFYNTSVANIVIQDVQGGYCEVDIEFISSDPYAYSSSTTELLNVINVTSGSKSYPVIVEGTATQAPTITMVLDTGSPTTNRTVSFGNPSDKTVLVERNWQANDTLIINCKDKSITVNGTATDFSGTFPVWDSGNGYFEYNDDFTERQVDINVIYTKRYL